MHAATIWRLTIIIPILIIVLLILKECSSDTPDLTSSVTTVVRTHRQRSDYWSAHVDRSDPANEADRRRYEMLRTTPLPQRSRSTPRTIPVAHLPRLIIAAQELIRSQGALPHAWAWEHVRASALSVGSRIPLELMPDDYALMTGEVSGAHYDWRRHRIGIRREYVQGGYRELTVEEIAAILIHECTHATYHTEVLEHTGYTRMELEHVLNTCDDTSFMDRFATEALAHVNEQVWIETHPIPLTPRSRYQHPIYDGAHRWIHEERDSAHAYASTIYRYDGVHGDAPLNGHSAVFCGPIVVKNSSPLGRRFYPSDVAPELLVDLFDALPLITRYAPLGW